MKRVGITIKEKIGIGDKLLFSSLPENFYAATGTKIIDVSKCWIYDHNPYVDRESTPDKTVEMWNFGPRQWTWPQPRTDREPKVYLSIAEIFACVHNVPVVMNRPRLYVHEEYPFAARKRILFQVNGKSHGKLPEHVVHHVIRKYAHTGELYEIGVGPATIPGIPKIDTPTIWDLVREISSAKMFIGPDSGPSWIAACYPDIVTKIVRMRPEPDQFKGWTPLEIANVHSHWDDRVRMVYNPTTKDIGFTWSYTRI